MKKQDFLIAYQDSLKNKYTTKTQGEKDTFNQMMILLKNGCVVLSVEEVKKN